MSRCKACDKILTKEELMSREDIDNDMCWTCIGVSNSKYNILTDKVYQFGWCDVVEDVSTANKCE